MVVIVDNVTATNEEGTREAVVKAAKSIERDIKDLLRCASYNLYSEMIVDC
jgi:hypothetical protein